MKTKDLVRYNMLRLGLKPIEYVELLEVVWELNSQGYGGVSEPFWMWEKVGEAEDIERVRDWLRGKLVGYSESGWEKLKGYLELIEVLMGVDTDMEVGKLSGGNLLSVRRIYSGKELGERIEKLYTKWDKGFVYLLSLGIFKSVEELVTLPLEAYKDGVLEVGGISYELDVKGRGYVDELVGLGGVEWRGVEIERLDCSGGYLVPRRTRCAIGTGGEVEVNLFQREYRQEVEDKDFTLLNVWVSGVVRKHKCLGVKVQEGEYGVYTNVIRRCMGESVDSDVGVKVTKRSWQVEGLKYINEKEYREMLGLCRHYRDKLLIYLIWRGLYNIGCEWIRGIKESGYVAERRELEVDGYGVFQLDDEGVEYVEGAIQEEWYICTNGKRLKLIDSGYLIKGAETGRRWGGSGKINVSVIDKLVRWTSGEKVGGLSLYYSGVVHRVKAGELDLETIHLSRSRRKEIERMLRDDK